MPSGVPRPRLDGRSEAYPPCRLRTLRSGLVKGRAAAPDAAAPDSAGIPELDCFASHCVTGPRHERGAHSRLIGQAGSQSVWPQTQIELERQIDERVLVEFAVELPDPFSPGPDAVPWALLAGPGPSGQCEMIGLRWTIA